MAPPGVVWQVPLKLICLLLSPHSQSPHPLLSPNASGAATQLHPEQDLNRVKHGVGCGVWSTFGPNNGRVSFLGPIPNLG